MPRIDPSQLLRTLSQLLSVEGGIRSAEEVPRIVKLMQKFSKKLVSKCIYIHILRASEMDLLELFLQQKGWDLLNLWFMDSINCQNWYLCGDLVKLFAICPMNPARLKENVEVNQAPKLIRQLSIDSRLEADIRNQAQQVLQQWMSVIRAPPAPQQIQATVSASQPSPPSPPASGDDCGDKSADWKPEAAAKKKKPEKKITLTKNKSLSPDDSVDVDDLLGGDSSSEDEDEPIKKKKAEIERRRQEREDRKAKDEERERKKAQERKEKSKLGYSKSELGNRGSVDSQEKERIREVARKMKEESEQKQKSKNPESKPPEAEQKGNRMTDGLGRIPKLPKKEPSQEVKKGKEVPSFGDLLGGMDTPKPPKAIIKNKNKDLMDSLMNNSPTKPSAKKEERKRSLVPESRSRDKEDSKSRDKEDSRSRDKEDSRSRDKEERHKAKEERRSSLSGKETPDKSSKEKSGDSKSPSGKSVEKNGHKESSSSSVRPKPSLVMPDREEKKNSVKEASPEVKKAQSPKVIKESNFFGDVLGDVMKEQPRKRKRRLSEVRAEREAKDEAEKAEKRRKEEEAEEATRKEKSPSEEKMETEENGGDGGDLELFPEEPSCELPREVRGILVLARGARKTRKLQWKSDSELIDIRYFEMDETERANVWKQKTFEEMRKAESQREKQLGHTTVEEQEEKEWKAVAISFRDSEMKNQVEKIWECYGKGSTEKGVQETREGRVLKSLFFNALPSDPTEPDQADRGGDSRSTVDIPGEDQSDADTTGESTVDHSNNGWPTPKGILNPHLNAPPPSLNSADAELFQAQAAAAAALAQQQQQEFHSQQQGPGEYPQHLQEHGPERYPQEHGPERYPLDRPPPGYQRGHHNDRGHHHNNFHRDRSHSSPRFPPSREEFHGGFRGGPGYRGREGRREDRRDGRDFKRPCKFWMDRGSCKQEDKCLYPHPGR